MGRIATYQIKGQAIISYQIIINGHERKCELQGPQGLSAHFNLAQTGRKNVAMSKLMIPCNSQRRKNSKGEVSFYVPIIYQPQ